MDPAAVGPANACHVDYEIALLHAAYKTTYNTYVVSQSSRAIVATATLLLGAVIGAWLSWSMAYLVFEPAEREASGALLVTALGVLLAGLAFVARRVLGARGLVAFVPVVLSGAIAAGWLIL